MNPPFRFFFEGWQTSSEGISGLPVSPGRQKDGLSSPYAVFTEDLLLFSPLPPDSCNLSQDASHHPNHVFLRGLF